MTHAFPAFYNPDGTIDWIATVRDYTVALTVVDDSDPALDDTDTAIVHITAPPWPPVADANGPYVIYPCRTVILDGSGSYDPNGSIVDYAWDFGDGTTGSGVAPTHTYAEDGIYIVVLCVTDNHGNIECCSPSGQVVPTEHSTWGTLKTWYR